MEKIKEQANHKTYMSNMRDEASRAFTLKIDIDYAVSNALKNMHEKYIIKLWDRGKSIEFIADIVEMSLEEVTQLIENYKNSKNKNE
jgi:NADH:ubiquinone oxidoreductase subunit E